MASIAENPPQNKDAEQALLGALMITDKAWSVVTKSKLAASDFYSDRHGAIFATIQQLAGRGAPCDEISVSDALNLRGDLEKIGGKDAISLLVANVAAPGNAAHYASIVLTHAIQRQKGDVGQGLRNGLGPVEAIERLRKLARRSEGADGDRRFRVLDVASMVANRPPEIPWVIEGFAVEGTLTLLSGKEGEGKSLVSMALGIGVALGEDVAGFTCVQKKVLIIDAENGEYEIHRRVKTLGLPSEGVGVVEADDFHLGRDLGALDALLEREEPGLVILDSFRSLWPGGDENDSGAVAAVLDPLRNLLRRRGVAGILLHHVSRAGNDYRGTSAIGAAIELGFRLARHPNDPEARDRRYLRCFKSRPAREPEDRWLRLHIERGQVFIDATDSFVSEEDEEKPLAPARAELAPGLLQAAADPTGWPDLARAIGRSPKDGTARRLRDDLLGAGELVRLEDGRLQVPEGMAPAISAWQSGETAGCQSAGPPIGAEELAPADEHQEAEAERLAAKFGVSA